MSHEDELARLPAWARPIIAGLLEQRPRALAASLEIPLTRVTWARRVGWKVLGDASPLMIATRRWPPGPARGTADWSRAGDTDLVALLTTPGPDGHVHVARFNSDNGNGRTDLVAGHQHRVLELELVAASGHRHELTDQRA